jgi:hypothetical protein
MHITVVSRVAIEFFCLHKFDIIQNLRKMAAPDRHKTAKQMLTMSAREARAHEGIAGLIEKALLVLLESADLGFTVSMASTLNEDGSVRGIIH